jgi:hypothetical protein
MTAPLASSLLKLSLSVGAEALAVRELTGQVTDSVGASQAGVKLVRVHVTGSTDNKMTLDATTGTKLYAGKPAVGASELWLTTDKYGTFVATLTAGAALTTALVHATVDGGVPAFLSTSFVGP